MPLAVSAGEALRLDPCNAEALSNLGCARKGEDAVVLVLVCRARVRRRLRRERDPQIWDIHEHLEADKRAGLL